MAIHVISGCCNTVATVPVRAYVPVFRAVKLHVFDQAALLARDGGSAVLNAGVVIAVVATSATSCFLNLTLPLRNSHDDIRLLVTHGSDARETQDSRTLVPKGAKEVCNSVVAQTGCLDDEETQTNRLPTAVGDWAPKRRCHGVFRKPLIHRR